MKFCQNCNPSYLGGREWDVRLTRPKYYSDLHLNKQAGVVANVCNTSYMGDLGRRVVLQGWPRQKA
jgi:hypothetical protein